MTLDFTKAAVAGLQSIREYTLETWGMEQERIYLDSMWNRFEEILANSDRWRGREDLFPGCQIAAQGIQVNLIRNEGKVIQVARILHSAMDFKRHLPKNAP